MIELIPLRALQFHERLLHHVPRPFAIARDPRRVLDERKLKAPHQLAKVIVCLGALVLHPSWIVLAARVQIEENDGIWVAHYSFAHQ